MRNQLFGANPLATCRAEHGAFDVAAALPRPAPFAPPAGEIDRSHRLAEAVAGAGAPLRAARKAEVAPIDWGELWFGSLLLVPRFTSSEFCKILVEKWSS